MRLRMITVLPTPAPPRPALPPRQRTEQVDDLDAGLEHFGLRGQLLHLGRKTVDRAAFAGLHRTAVVDRPPTRLNTRPRVSSPTGTCTGEPVSRISAPRLRPSVEPSETARTRPPPRCWATSHQGLLERLAQHGALDVDLERVVQGHGSCASRELRVERRADDLSDLSNVAGAHMNTFRYFVLRPARWRRRRCRAAPS